MTRQRAPAQGARDDAGCGPPLHSLERPELSGTPGIAL